MAEEQNLNENIEEATELTDSFADYFSSEESTDAGVEGKKKKGPDILAVSETSDEGMVIDEVVEVKEEAPAEEPVAALEEASDGKEQKTLFPKAQEEIDKRKHKSMATIGTLVIILAFLGLFTFGRWAVGFITKVANNTFEKETLEWTIYPLVMLDPATFDDPSQIDEAIALKSCLWKTLLQNRMSYEYDENMLLVVPASDLDVAAKKLYGDRVTLNHQTFSDGYELFYLYDEDNKVYKVPVSGQTAGYTPKVVEIRKNDNDSFTLIVGYVEPTTLWNMSSDGAVAEEVPSKYMYYDLVKLGYNDYNIVSVRDIPADELPDNLEVASQQSLNQTNYNVDYDALYEEYMQGDGMEDGENIPEESEAESESDSSEESGSESSENEG